MSALASSAPGPNLCAAHATRSTDVYVNKHRPGSMPSLTLAPSENDRSVITSISPEYGLTPNLFTCRTRTTLLGNGPRIP